MSTDNKLDMSTKKELVEYAKLAEQAERYDDMASTMKKVITESTEKLQVEERNLFSVAYKNIAGARRSAWRVISSMEQKHEGRKRELASTFKEKIVNELLDICTEVFELIEKYLLTKVSETVEEDVEDVVFYRKMQGDYHRYAAEVSEDDRKAEEIRKAGESYEKASKVDMVATDPVRLGLALNYSVFFYEMKGEVKTACKLAKESFDKAIAELDHLTEDSYKDSTLIMQLLRDNLTLWTSENEAEEEAD
ncbi:14-3-3 protein beta/alpha-B-like [Anneissia japonica]|uniref:14-3-3 protein beta/alpha-B-like n=1 Tax=Anneissia japonica TaxID=1529436 RepID=UPI0014254C47|nr:14-3-3 protein beta/alpha-B-like [Anneissia japonica]